MPRPFTINFKTNHLDFLDQNNSFICCCRDNPKIHPALIRTVFEHIILNNLCVIKLNAKNNIDDILSQKNSKIVTNYILSLTPNDVDNFNIMKNKLIMRLTQIYGYGMIQGDFFLKKELEDYTKYIRLQKLAKKLKKDIPVNNIQSLNKL